uniref:Uncharacterized protein n=1 Tax=Picea sitchensis TaxID=3332 RepID=A9NXI6_PICSI|nr:unknown [Picea sitchensis]
MFLSRQASAIFRTSSPSQEKLYTLSCRAIPSILKWPSLPLRILRHWTRLCFFREQRL